jgi:hypothetical protein
MNSALNIVKSTIGITVFASIFILLTVNFGITVPLLGLGLSVALLYFYKIIQDLRWGFYLLLAANFFSVGLTRYVSLPLGLLIDFILLLLFVVFFLKKFKNITWKPLSNPVFIIVSVWMLINILEIANPQARSIEAWFYAMRGVVLYFFLTLLISYLCLDQKKDFQWFIYLWFIFSILGTLWGMKQFFIGLDLAEKAWLNVPGNLSTHLLFGRLRVFSFYSDAGQFGASQAHTALVATILALSSLKTKEKIFFGLTAVLCFYGMLISGTRGAFAIPIIGFLTYLLLIRNFKIVVAGTSILAILFVLLKFTFIGQGNYQIQRLRSSLNPQDASLQVRIANQKKLAGYLKTHPLGGGVGSGGYWGQRFSPNTFLANLALDSWYVRIAAEYGYPGLLFYVFMLLFILFKSLQKIKNEIDTKLKKQLIALFCGLSGILVASYSNQVLGQMPTGIIIYLSIVFLTQIKPTSQTDEHKLTQGIHYSG